MRYPSASPAASRSSWPAGKSEPRAHDQNRAISVRNPRRRPREDREWRKALLLAGIAVGLLVLVAAKVFADYF